MKRTGALLLASMMVCSMALAGCGEAQAEAEEEEEVYEALKVDLVNPKTATIINTGEFMGTVESGDIVTIVAKANGEILETMFEEGDMVTEGDLLFKIDAQQADAALKTAQAAYQSTKSTVDRMLGSSLDSQTINVATGYKNAEIGVDTANYNLAKACEKLSDAKKAVSDIQSSIDELNGKCDDLRGKMSKMEQDSPEYEQMKGQLQSLEGQVSSLKGSKSTMESTRNQLEDSIHTYENQIKSAEVNMDSAAASLAVTVTKVLNETLDAASTTLNQSQVAVNNARDALKNYSTTSPVSGKIQKKYIDQYGMAQAGAPAYDILTDDTRKIVFYVGESNIGIMEIGKPLTIEYAGNSYQASISKIGDEVDAQTGLFKIEAMVDAGDDLYLGASVKITLETARADQAMTIPVDAVYYESEKPYVYLDVNDVATKTFIETGIFDDELIQVISGLDATSQVVSTWSARLKDGEIINGAY